MSIIRKDSNRYTLKFQTKGIQGAALLGTTGTGNFMNELAAVKRQNAQIINILTTQKADDVQELLQTAQKAQVTLDRLFERVGTSRSNVLQSKLMLDAVDKLAVIVTDYVNTLMDLKGKNLLSKSLTSSRGRRKFEQLNSALLVEATVLEELSDDVLTTHDSGYPRLPKFDAVEEKVQISDAEGHALWVDIFGDTAFMVDVNKLVKGLMKVLNVNLSTAERKILLQVFDPSNTGTISSLRWSEFLKGFGPMSQCLYNLQEMLAKPWFHGFLSRDDATKLLEVEPAGTFMVRFSSTKPGSFSLAHTMPMGKVNHVIITTRENGFAIREDNARENIFPSVQHLVDAYEGILVAPYQQTFPRQLWWHGDITAEEASELLRGKKPGTFLIRFSATQRGCFASSYVGGDGSIEKGLIVGSPHGYQLSGKLFASIEEIVESLITWNIFSEPYKNTTNEVNDRQRYKIVSEIVSTERSYVHAMHTTVDIFLKDFLRNPKVDDKDVASIFGNIEKLLECHQSFLASLEHQLANWEADETRLGYLFLNLVPNLLGMYSPYVNGYTDGMKRLDALLENKSFSTYVRSLLDKLQKDASFQNSLSSFLITPVQRIPRYILLLTDLIKHSSGAHIDYDDLGDAIHGLKGVADRVNENKRASEDMEEMRALTQKITDLGEELAMPGRGFVREGKIVPLEDGKVKSNDYWCFLVSDMLLLTKKKGKTYKYKAKIPLVNTQVLSIPDSGGLKNQIRVAGLDSEWTLVADDPDSRDQWLAALKKCSGKLADLADGAPDLNQSTKSAKLMGMK